MAKRRHEEEQAASSKTTMAVMAIGGIAVAALVVWALTRTVQPAPSVTATGPVGVERPADVATNTAPLGTTAATPAGTTAATPPPNQPPVADENASVPRVTVAELRPQVDAKQVTVIDVRDKTAFMGGHIPGSLNVPVAQVESQVTFLPKDKPIVTVCT